MNATTNKATKIDYLAHNTTAEKPFAVYFDNFGYYSHEGPFATLDMAIAVARKVGFNASVYSSIRKTMDGSIESTLHATYDAIGGVRRW